MRTKLRSPKIWNSWSLKVKPKQILLLNNQTLVLNILHGWHEIDRSILSFDTVIFNDQVPQASCLLNTFKYTGGHYLHARFVKQEHAVLARSQFSSGVTCCRSIVPFK